MVELVRLERLSFIPNEVCYQLHHKLVNCLHILIHRQSSKKRKGGPYSDRNALFTKNAQKLRRCSKAINFYAPYLKTKERSR